MRCSLAKIGFSCITSLLFTHPYLQKAQNHSLGGLACDTCLQTHQLAKTPKLHIKHGKLSSKGISYMNGTTIAIRELQGSLSASISSWKRCEASSITQIATRQIGQCLHCCSSYQEPSRNIFNKPSNLAHVTKEVKSKLPVSLAGADGSTVSDDIWCNHRSVHLLAQMQGQGPIARTLAGADGGVEANDSRSDACSRHHLTRWVQGSD